MVIYGYCLLQGANLLSDGSEMLLEILDPGLIGGAPRRTSCTQHPSPNHCREGRCPRWMRSQLAALDFACHGFERLS